jgi:hypothetical protein
MSGATSFIALPAAPIGYLSFELWRTKQGRGEPLNRTAKGIPIAHRKLANRTDSNMHIKLKNLLTKLNEQPTTVSLEEALRVIDENYDFVPTEYRNGGVVIAADKARSCKLFAFAILNKLTVEQTLNCFGAHYRDDVLGHPEGFDHQVIRLFLKHGWHGLKFDNFPLSYRGQEST